MSCANRMPCLTLHADASPVASPASKETRSLNRGCESKRCMVGQCCCWSQQQLCALNVLQQQLDTCCVLRRMAVYRLLSALCTRRWAAVEVVLNAELLERLIDARAESAATACQWRFVSLQVLRSIALVACSIARGRVSDTRIELVEVSCNTTTIGAEANTIGADFHPTGSLRMCSGAQLGNQWSGT